MNKNCEDEKDDYFIESKLLAQSLRISCDNFDWLKENIYHHYRTNGLRSLVVELYNLKLPRCHTLWCDI